jgi:hypothetical protein
MELINSQRITNASSVDTEHPSYTKNKKAWARIRDCIDGEDVIKSKQEMYLPRPAGMSGEYAEAYDGYIERAHFPLVTSYALSGALGIVITKLPEFNVPPQLEYIIKTATKDGKSISQLFLDVVIEIFQTGRVPLLVDVVPNTNQFRFVQYSAEEFINWKTTIVNDEKNLSLAVLKETTPASDDILSHETEDLYRVLVLDENGNYSSRIFLDDGEIEEKKINPTFMGKSINEVPLFLAGSINNSFDMQPIPLISVADCSIQIYRKEADLANSEFLSCNPTLVLVGASNDDDLPNVVGSSVMIVIPNEQARVFYTETDTAALTHVKEHIKDLYEEAIRHGVAILDARKGVEAAESLRIRQSTQSASIYSIYLAAMNAIKTGLQLMCKWGGYNEDDVILDAPASLTQGIPDSSILKEIINGYNTGVIPLSVIHRYLIYSGLLDQTIGFEDYVKLLEENQPVNKIDPNVTSITDADGNIITQPKKSETPTDSVIKQSEGAEDQS